MLTIANLKVKIKSEKIDCISMQRLYSVQMDFIVGKDRKKSKKLTVGYMCDFETPFSQLFKFSSLPPVLL